MPVDQQQSSHPSEATQNKPPQGVVVTGCIWLACSLGVSILAISGGGGSARVIIAFSIQAALVIGILRGSVAARKLLLFILSLGVLAGLAVEFLPISIYNLFWLVVFAVVFRQSKGKQHFQKSEESQTTIEGKKSAIILLILAIGIIGFIYLLTTNLM